MDKVLQELKEGDKAIFERIYLNYSPKVYSFARRYMKNDSDADDIVQDVFIRLWEARTTINSELNFDNYLFTITRNLIFDRHRMSVNELYFQDTVLASLQKEEPYYLQENEIIADDLASFINKVVEKLPPKQKEVYNLSRHQMLTYREIAEKLNISVKTVEAHIYQVLKIIRKNLEKG